MNTSQDTCFLAARRALPRIAISLWYPCVLITSGLNANSITGCRSSCAATSAAELVLITASLVTGSITLPKASVFPIAIFIVFSLGFCSPILYKAFLYTLSMYPECAVILTFLRRFSRCAICVAFSTLLPVCADSALSNRRSFT